MTKQEEIREGIDANIEFVLMAAYHAGKTGVSMSETTDKCRVHLKEYLYSQGVVIKVKCPHCAWSQFQSDESVAMTPCHNCASTGYITEPLIKEL